jgi:transposase-like protein
MKAVSEVNNLMQVMAYFSSDAVCRKHMENLRWKNGVACPFCGTMKIYRFKDGKYFKCADCRKKFTVTVGTVFENTKVPLSKWFVAIYLISSHKKGISSCQLARDLSVKQQTAWFMLHRIREMMRDKEHYEFTGVTECDEVFIGGKISNMHKHIRAKIRAEKHNGGTMGKTPVLAFLERGKGKVHTQIIPAVSAPILIEAVKANVKEGAKVMTDSHSGYYNLKNDYDHQIVSHSTDEYVRGEVHTNTVEGFFSLLSRSIYGIYHQVSKKHLIRYCQESGFRYETRKAGEMERINISLANCEGRLKYADLIAKKK